jgi:hypothetical protein
VHCLPPPNPSCKTLCLPAFRLEGVELAAPVNAMETIFYWRRAVAKCPCRIICVRRHPDIRLDPYLQNKQFKAPFESGGRLRRQVSKAAQSERMTGQAYTGAQAKRPWDDRHTLQY